MIFAITKRFMVCNLGAALIVSALSGCAAWESLFPPDQPKPVAAVQANAEPQAVEKPGVPVGTSGLACRDMDEGPVEVVTYGRAAMAAVRANWRAPKAAPPGMAASVRVRVDADGRIRSTELAAPSGNRAFDTSVLEAVRRTRRLPPPPAAVGDCIVMNFKAVRKAR